jgi:hypothetical protein
MAKVADHEPRHYAVSTNFLLFRFILVQVFFPAHCSELYCLHLISFRGDIYFTEYRHEFGPIYSLWHGVLLVLIPCTFLQLSYKLTRIRKSSVGLDRIFRSGMPSKVQCKHVIVTDRSILLRATIRAGDLTWLTLQSYSLLILDAGLHTEWDIYATEL